MGAYEDLLAFLAPFAEGADGYLGFVRADRSQDPDDNKKWGEFHNWYGSCGQGEVDLPFDVLSENPKWEYYFTPAVLTEENRRQSKFGHSNVIWIDFDEPVDWAEFEPAPSIVVQTSEEKHHCYWVLREPITNPNDMRYWNSRFVHFFGPDESDKSGIDATQLLKLPWGLNLKLGSRNEDGTPWSPRVIKFDPDLKYSEADFVNVPEPPVEQDTVVDLDAIGAVPEVEKGYRGYLDEYTKQIPKKLHEKVLTAQEGGEEKRSGVLYNLTCELFDALNDPSRVFHVLLGSPNDKFSADHGARGADLLWKDINRVCSKRKDRERVSPQVAEEISEILADKDLSRDEQEFKIAESVMEKLRKTGKFLLTANGEAYYADQKTGNSVTLYDVSISSESRFVSLCIRKRNGFLAGSNSKRITNISHEALAECLESKPVRFHHFAYYDYMRNLVYVDRYDGTMYVLDGESIVQQPHGYDNVWFHQEHGSEFPRPFEYISEYPEFGLETLILDGPNYTTQGNGISRAEIRHMLKTWVTSFFFPELMDTRPIVLVQGSRDSGKTTFFQNLSIMLTGDSTDAVADMPDNTRLFDVHVSQSSYLFYDNVEVNKKELQRKLAQVATGYTVKDRKMYTNNQMISDKARAFVGITSRTLDRIQDDVASRYIILPVHTFSAKTQERRPLNEILKDVMRNRDALWSELLDFVNLTIKEVGQHGLGRGTVKIRMAEYGALLDLTCGMAGLSYKKMENFIRKMQAEVVSENDPLFNAFKDMVEALDHDPERKYKSKELLDALTRINRKVGSAYPTPNKFTRQIQTYINDEQLERHGVEIIIHKSGNNSSFSVRATQ